MHHIRHRACSYVRLLNTKKAMKLTCLIACFFILILVGEDFFFLVKKMYAGDMDLRDILYICMLN